jgi:predicted nucleic acid-binding protein
LRTAVDSSVLLDVIGGETSFGVDSREALRAAHDAGSLIACDVVWAEVRAHFPDDDSLHDALNALGLQFDPLSDASAELAGSLWREYRATRAGRGRVVADFLVGAHARLQADRLLTRDRGFYRGYFSGLRILDPTA